MIVLGLNTFGENPSACLLRDGKLLAMSQEDRFTRLKGSEGAFPAQAVSWCLSREKITLGDVNRIAVSWDCTKYPWKMLGSLLRMKLAYRGQPYVHPPSIRHISSGGAALEYLYQHTPGAFERGIRYHLRAAGHHGPLPPIEFVDHHLSHAWQVFYQSPFEEAAVMVVDGSGEEHCVSGYAARKTGMKRVFAYDVPRSLGWYYAAFTAYLGFRANRDEGKLMGLAALGESRRNRNPWIERLDKVIRVTPEGFELDPLYLKLGGNEFHPRFTDHLHRFVTSAILRWFPSA
jgi:carbamoyltransferase